MFLDEAKINIKAGDGGSGLVSFFFLKGSYKKIASGGNGGRGGNIIIEASNSVSTLLGFKKKIHFKAKNGQPGMPNNRTGAAGSDSIIHVPVGTIIKDGNIILADLDTEGKQFFAASGGMGGRGNANFVSQKRRFPAFAEKGEKVTEKWINLELRLFADAALVGFPNAGKSTIISRVSAARPRIADYPFTTLTPNLGVVSINDDTFVMADIPGIIEGAHSGTGLGDRFLKHILRSKILIIVLDLSVILNEGLQSLISTYDTLRMELKLYDIKLYRKDFLIAINKADLMQSKKEISGLKSALVKKSRKPVLLISAVSGEGIEEFLKVTYEKILKARAKEEEYKKEVNIPGSFRLYKLTEKDRGLGKIEVVQQGQEIIIKNKNLERMVAMTELENEEALDYLKYKFKKMKIGEKLKKMGINEGSTVIIGNLVFEMMD